MHPFVLLFMALWFGLAVPLGLAGALAGHADGLLMAGLGVAIVWLGRWGAKNDHKAIESRFRRVLNEPAA
jgi:hypothetical protein